MSVYDVSVCNRGGLDCSNKQHNNNMRVCVCARICMCARWGLRVFTKRIWVTMFTQIFTDNLLISKLRDYYAIFLRFVCSAVCMCVYHSECKCVCHWEYHCILIVFLIVFLLLQFSLVSFFLCMSEFDNDAKIQTENTNENETANGTRRLRRHRCNKDKIQWRQQPQPHREVVLTKKTELENCTKCE